MSELSWQFPNATEAHASQLISKGRPLKYGNYLSYPWASWIDAHNCGRDLSAHQAPVILSDGSFLVSTVCQHVWALRYIDIFKSAGVTDLFWSHAVAGLREYRGVRIHPFPLFPVRCSTHPPASTLTLPQDRSFLFSFQGAYDSSYYLTPVREWIFGLPPRSDCVVVRRDQWHYHDVIYNNLIMGDEIRQDAVDRLEVHAHEYVHVLADSCFALCPSGSGPNSIRLWEALGYGAIPVIISDRISLPGDPELWRRAALFVPEEKAAIEALPARLSTLAGDADRLTEMASAGRLLWKLYGLSAFIRDLESFHSDPHSFLLKRNLTSVASQYHHLRFSDADGLIPAIESWHASTPSLITLVIQIMDTSDFSLLDRRWGDSLKRCRQILAGRSWLISSLSPRLEGICPISHSPGHSLWSSTDYSSPASAVYQ
jgi:hypothetical protein